MTGQKKERKKVTEYKFLQKTKKAVSDKMPFKCQGWSTEGQSY